MDTRPARSESHICNVSSTLLSHIESANQLFESERQLVAAPILEQTMEAMARATRHAIGNMDIDCNQAAVVNSALASSAFSGPLRAALAQALASRVIAGATIRTTARRANQLFSVPQLIFHEE